MSRVPCYKDQWNISLPESATFDELRACVLYEYARECQVFVDHVERHRLDPRDTTHGEPGHAFGFTPLEGIDCLSGPLANVVQAMGTSASLKKPWSRLAVKVRAAITAAVSAPVRFATPDELECSYCWPHFDEMPPMGTIFSIDPRCDDAAGEDPRRFLTLVVDTQATAAQIKDDIVRFFDREIAPLLEGARGRNASGKPRLRAALDNLAALRLLAWRDPALAASVAACAGRRDLLRQRTKRSVKDKSEDSPTEPTPYTFDRVAAARQTFRTLFPSLFLHEESYPKEHMISAAAYDARHPSTVRHRPSRQKKSPR